MMVHLANTHISELLNDYFCSVFTRYVVAIPFLSSKIFDTLLTDTQITPEEVLLIIKIAISQVCWSRSMSPQGTVQCLRKFSCPLTLFLTGLCKMEVCLILGRKLLVAIHKKDANNYRPVSLTSVIYKMLEAIIKNHIYYHHLESNALLSDHQYGFQPGISCEPQLLRIVNHV